jgi:hypothetical protein
MRTEQEVRDMLAVYERLNAANQRRHQGALEGQRSA